MKLTQTAKLVVAAALFGRVVYNAFKSGIVDELKSIKLTDTGEIFTIIPQVITAVRAEDQVAQVAEAAAQHIASMVPAAAKSEVEEALGLDQQSPA